MRVGVIGAVFPDSFADNVLTCLPGVGATAVPLGPAQPRPRNRVAARGLAAAGRASSAAAGFAQRALVRRAEEAALDVVVSLDGRLRPETVDALRGRRIRVALWFPDHVASLDRGLPLVTAYDALFFKDPVLVERLAAIQRLPAHYLPEAANPAWHRPPAAGAAPGAEPWIAVVGNLYAARARLLSELLDSGLPLRIYGAPVPRWLPDRRLAALHTGRAVTRHEKAAVFRGAAAVLNNLHPAEHAGVNCRLFEATACGAAVLTEDRPALDGLFRRDTEVAAFAGFDQLVTRAKDLLADPAAGRALGDAAAARAAAEHTYHHRLTRILEVLA